MDYDRGHRVLKRWAPLHVPPGSVHLRGGSLLCNLERGQPKYLTGGHKYIINLPGFTKGGLQLLYHKRGYRVLKCGHR